MYVRMKTGVYAGEVRDIASHVALELIRNDRAERISFDPDSPEPPVPAEIAVTPEIIATPAPIATTKQARKAAHGKGRT